MNGNSEEVWKAPPSQGRPGFAPPGPNAETEANSVVGLPFWPRSDLKMCRLLKNWSTV